MADDVDELVMLVLDTAGWYEAIAIYEEETGCTRAESVQAVEKLSRRVDTGRNPHIAKRLGIFGAVIAAMGTLALFLALS